MTRGLIISLASHVLLMALAIWGLPSWLEEQRIEEPQAISVQVLDVADITNVPNRMPTPPKKEPVEEPPKPEPQPPKPKPQPPVKKETPPPTPKPEPVVTPEPPKEKPTPKPKEEKKPEPKPKPEKPKEPEPKKEEEMDLDAILKSVKDTAQQQPDEATDSAPSDAQSKSDTAYIDSLPLTMSEKDAIRNQIAKCWSPPIGAKDAENLAAQLRVTYEKDGSLINVYLAAGQQARYQTDSFFRSAVDSAMRAVRACTPLQGMPPDKYQRWKDVELTFDPRDMLY